MSKPTQDNVKIADPATPANVIKPKAMTRIYELNVAVPPPPNTELPWLPAGTVISAYRLDKEYPGSLARLMRMATVSGDAKTVYIERATLPLNEDGTFDEILVAGLSA